MRRVCYGSLILYKYKGSCEDIEGGFVTIRSSRRRNDSKSLFPYDERRANDQRAERRPRKPRKPRRRSAVEPGLLKARNAPALLPVEAIRRQSRSAQAFRWHDSRVCQSQHLVGRGRMGCGCSVNRRVAAQKVGREGFGLLLSS